MYNAIRKSWVRQTMMSEESLDWMAKKVGRLYNELLIGTKLCEYPECEMHRQDGSCGGIDKVRELADAIWEAKAGRWEQLSKLMAEYEQEMGE